ncbi:hypothetical protein ACFL17_10045, partial [Pseudomonadota bacterium]
MDQGIWATWYDLPEGDNQDYFDWLHQHYLPALLQRPGYVWAAHYEITGGGESMQIISDRLVRPDDSKIGTGTQYVVLVGAVSPHVFFNPNVLSILENLDSTAKKMLKLRLGERVSIFNEEAHLNGPEFNQRAPGTTPGPAIQMGSFRIRSLEEEFDLGSWYAQYRFPAMARMPGCIATRKLVSIVGWAKHAVLYEFTSLE